MALAIGLLLGSGFVLLDVFIDSLVFSRETFGHALMHPEPGEIWERLVVLLAFSYASYAWSVVRSLSAARARAEEETATRLRIGAELRRTADELRLLLESTSEAILRVDSSGRCTFGNRAAAETLQTTAEAIVGADMHELLHGGSEHGRADCALVRAVAAGESASWLDDTFVRSNGQQIGVAASLSSLAGDSSAGGVLIFRDVTEPRARRQRAELDTRLAGVNNLAVGVAHEFNNVLMGIQPFAELLSRHPESAGHANHILRSVDRGKQVTREMVQFARPADLRMTAMSVRDWLGGAAESIRTILGSKVRLDILLPEHDLHISGDGAQLTQTLLNLAANSRDAMRDGGTFTISVDRIAASSRGLPTATGNLVRITVTDTGAGIDPEALPHVFEPLFKTRRASGVGLGLAIAYRIVAAHSGEIMVQSSPGEGATFKLFFPEVEASRAQPSSELAKPDTRHVRRVLLVEDEESVALGIQSALEVEGIEAVIAGTGAEALASLQRESFDAIVLDVALPDVNGFDLYHSIARAWPGVPVVFSSGHAELVRPEAVRASPMVAFLAKPYEVQALLATLAAITMPATTADTSEGDSGNVPAPTKC
jgi:PAS domain S-box-containing protein